MERKHKFLIRRLVDFTFEGDLAKLSERIQGVAQYLQQRYPQEAHTFLKQYASYLRKGYAERYMTVEFSGQFDVKSFEKMIQTLPGLSQQPVVASENPELIGGFKLQCKDDVWDVSLKGQLGAFIKTLK